MFVQLFDRQLERLDLQVRCSRRHFIEGEFIARAIDDALKVYYFADGNGLMRSASGCWTDIHCAELLVVPGATQQWFAAADRHALAMTCYEVSVGQSSVPAVLDLIMGRLRSPISASGELCSLLERINEEQEKAQIGSHAIAAALMKQCFILLLRARVAQEGTASTVAAAMYDARLARAIREILDRPAAMHSVRELAMVAGMSRSAFARHFIARLGQSPMKFVKEVRLQHAATLLRTTDLPIKAVASLSGYASRSHFSRAFRAEVNVDPSHYRQGER